MTRFERIWWVDRLAYFTDIIRKMAPRSEQLNMEVAPNSAPKYGVEMQKRYSSGVGCQSYLWEVRPYENLRTTQQHR